MKTVYVVIKQSHHPSQEFKGVHGVYKTEDKAKTAVSLLLKYSASTYCPSIVKTDLR